MVAEIDRDLPVLMIDSLMLFEETLDLSARPRRGISGSPTCSTCTRTLPTSRGSTRTTRCTSATPTPAAISARCCRSTGRSGAGRCRSPGASGSRPRRGPRCEVFEAEGARLKVNPLAHWSAGGSPGLHGPARPAAPPAGGQGLSSRSAAAPCTTPVAPGEDDRAGRWRGSDKVECGIHFGADGRILRAAS